MIDLFLGLLRFGDVHKRASDENWLSLVVKHSFSMAGYPHDLTGFCIYPILCCMVQRLSG